MLSSGNKKIAVQKPNPSQRLRRLIFFLRALQFKVSTIVRPRCVSRSKPDCQELVATANIQLGTYFGSQSGSRGVQTIRNDSHPDEGTSGSSSAHGALCRTIMVSLASPEVTRRIEELSFILILTPRLPIACCLWHSFSFRMPFGTRSHSNLALCLKFSLHR